jgi:cold shock protein
LVGERFVLTSAKFSSILSVGHAEQAVNEGSFWGESENVRQRLYLCRITNTPVMPTGKVKFFNEEKGFGFITNEETNQDVFVHVSGLVHEIRQNDHVSFEVQEGRKGPNAVNVSRLQ